MINIAITLRRTLSPLVALMLLAGTIAFAQPSYRTFVQNDLAEKKAKAGKILAASSCFTFVDTLPGATATSLHVRFNAEIISIEDSGGFTIVLDRKKTLHASGRTVAPGSSVTLCLTFAKKNLNVHTNFWYWDTNGVRFGPKYGEMGPSSSTAIQVQPNGGNVREYLYKHVITRPAGLVVGVPDTGHVGWIRYKTADRKYFPHTGLARCFDLISDGAGHTKPFDRRLNNPHVKKHNNHLLGEVHALKLAVLANDAGVTKPDTPATRLGDILYNDLANPGDPCNGKTIRQILLLADSALTYCSRYAAELYPELDTCVTRINDAFNGPYVAVSFNPFLLAGTHTLAEVPFLHDNPAIAPVLLPYQRVSIIDDAPAAFAVAQNFPNPFNPSTTIEFTLPMESMVTLKVYNLLGQEVATLLENELLDDGDRTVDFNAGSLTSGVYFYRVSARGVEDASIQFSSIKRMMLVK